MNNAEDEVLLTYRTNWREVPQVLIEPLSPLTTSPEEFTSICLETINRILHQTDEIIIVGYFMIHPNGIDGMTEEKRYNLERFTEYMNDPDYKQDNWLDILHKLLDESDKDHELQHLRIVFTGLDGRSYL